MLIISKKSEPKKFLHKKSIMIKVLEKHRVS